MSAFSSWGVKRVSEGHADMLNRAGSSVAAFDGYVLAFGGADRTPLSMNDLWKFELASNTWTQVEEKGDCPTPRSEHAVCTLGEKYMFLFGGIDFNEEAVFNDLYVLNTETMEWKYAGESGVEVMARSSHSLSIVQGANGRHCLVVFGGANPNEGPLGDVQYAMLPADLNDMAKDDFFVTWQTMECGTGVPKPCARETHCAVDCGGATYIIGGKADNMEMFRDVWRLRDIAGADAAEACLAWEEMDSLQLPLPLAAHSACSFINDAGTDVGDSAGSTDQTASSSSSSARLCVFGGIAGGSPEGIAFEKSFLLAPADGSTGWAPQAVTQDPALDARLSHRMCTLTSGNQAFIFAGLSPIEDFKDAWILST